jgi:hypothetical protein
LPIALQPSTQPGDLRARGHCAQLLEGQLLRPFDQPADLQRPVGKAAGHHLPIHRATRRCIAIASKIRRQIGLGEFLRHRAAPTDQMVRAPVQPFGGRQ